MIDQREYLNLARESGAYSDIELDILGETLAEWSEDADARAILVELRDGKTLAGFATVRREEASDSTFGVQDLCVGAAFKGTGVIGDLLAKLEGEILRGTGSAILRIETSTVKTAAFGPGALERSGYSLIGHIPDFYVRGNDYYMFARHLHAGESA
jgi:hypothetical protein